jgi:MoxR-like ATPase
MSNNGFAESAGKLQDNLAKVIKGKEQTLRLVFTSLLAGGHVLLEDVPGTGKTTLAKALAKSISGIFKRIQFTPDLLPADITGSSYYNPKESSFAFREGPVFANVVLADEINRTSPRTQSALLEVMSENQITIEGQRRELPQPFFVIATQNPIEQEGTYPLPEAQLDRFMFNVKVDYPAIDEERLIVSMSTRGDRPELTKVLSGERIVAWQKLVRKIEVPNFVIEFIVRLVRATRPKDPSSPDMIKRLVDWGAGPRAGLFLAQAGQAFAAMDGRPSVAIDDVKKAAIPVMRHRVSANFQAQAEGKNSDDIVTELLKIVSEPEPRKYVDKKR